MLVILAAATVASTPAPRVFVERPVLAGETVCAPTGRYEIADPALLYRHDGKARFTSLGVLPRANHEKAVLRTVDGCSAPVVVRYGVGR